MEKTYSITHIRTYTVTIDISKDGEPEGDIFAKAIEAVENGQGSLKLSEFDYLEEL